MNKKTKYFFAFLSTLSFILVIQVIYLYNSSYSSSTIQQKQNFVRVSLLPDLAISTEASFVRHRSLVNSFDIFRDGPEHLEYFPTTFSINHGKKYEK